MSSRPSRFALTRPGSLRMFSTSEMLTMPPPTWLIDGILPAGGLVGLYGPPGVKKSFLAVDIALSVAAGGLWQGHAVTPGFPLYISAEGGTGIGKRIHAWLLNRQLKPRQAEGAWLTESVPVYADSDGMARILERIEDELDTVPHLIVIDTLARCFDGDENQQEDMGRFVAGVDRLRKDLDATVLVVHHTRLDGDRERGNTAFRGAADTMLSLANVKGKLILQCNKQKDSEEFPPIELYTQAIAGTDSIAILNGGSPRAAAKVNRLQEMLGLIAFDTPLSWDDWFQKAVELGVSRTTFHRHVVELKESGKTLKKQGLWHRI